MFESRCGISCNNCTGRAAAKCTGCLTMEKPFWGGDCPVKSCCEGKELNHCGECDVFPCEILSGMGKDEGYDPMSRLENCRRWAR